MDALRVGKQTYVRGEAVSNMRATSDWAVAHAVKHHRTERTQFDRAVMDWYDSLSISEICSTSFMIVDNSSLLSSTSEEKRSRYFLC